MDFNVITSGLKNSWNTFVSNIVAYIVGFLIMAIGSILIVTIAPLVYGMTYMVLKGVRGEKVEIKDIFYGFKSLNVIIRSWIGLIGIALVPIIIVIIEFVVVGALTAVSPTAGVLAGLVFLLIVILVEIFLFFAFYIYVMVPSENIIYAIKESAAIGKSNIILVILAIIISGILGFIGGLLFGIGVLITGPIATLFGAYVLKELAPGISDASGQ
ncbi:hypothetical protein MmiHf6_15620 [Methanimicrococcus hongohii]|uniref:DUF4013 domain-containing protein n=1 Tax=Methanimicrococcus hongohii TaxID=3028295 RepID=A0AA96ZUX7_9EURY|nr:hypothetical protein [Methanimicrococcus sp. Hf6]WNY24232.1 hypothetical protein MmiHf6_15620 [Methanimicrococcus sp. Hf6]